MNCPLAPHQAAPERVAEEIPVPRTPLAEALRPRTVDEVIGQRHLLGPGKPLDAVLRSGRPHSMILWGPPGVGKTTLARLIADGVDSVFISLSAVMAGSSDIRAAIEQATAQATAQAAQQGARGRPATLFVDEIHRLSKPQQELLLPSVRAGLVTLIGATTENPSFALKSALLSRARVHVLEPLADAEMLRLLRRARERALGHLHLDDTGAAALIAYADGDARRCLNLLEQARTAADAAGVTAITAGFVQEALTPHLRRFDKGGENFYDQISALHKSVRGSHPDAALYWLCRMLDGGVDRRYILRRLTAMAWDDIGLADPRAIRLVNAAADTLEGLGSPEGELALAQATLYLAVAEKSNASSSAFGQAMAFVRGGGTPPTGMRAPGWYAPMPRGLELRIAEKMERLRSLAQGARDTLA
jgi:putative ATPase